MLVKVLKSIYRKRNLDNLPNKSDVNMRLQFDFRCVFFFHSRKLKNCRIVLFTACRTSLIFQQYNIGFNEELR